MAYNPSNQLPISKGLGTTGNFPVAGKYEFYYGGDGGLFVYRPYVSVAEIGTHISSIFRRKGDVFLVNSGGTLDSGTGIITGGTNTEYWYKDDTTTPVAKSAGGGGGSSTWGSITGTLSAQTDLNSALLSKQPGLVSGSNIKTINGNSILGSGDLTISGGGGGSGTVTSVAVTVPTGLQVVSGSPITSSGTISIGYQSGYAIPLTATQANWNSAYSHSLILSGNPHGSTLQDVLTYGNTGTVMKITTSMEIPTVAPTTINSGSVWVGAGTNATIVKRSKVVSVTDQVLTTLAIGTAEAGKYIVSTNVSAIAATISTGEALSSVFVRQGGAGKITFTGSGVTVLVKPSKSAKTEGQNAVVEIFYETATRVIITGDLDT